MSKDLDFDYRPEHHGFTWGPATVTRLTTLPSGLVIGLATAAGRRLQIYVSAKGKSVRVHEGMDEWGPRGRDDGDSPNT